MHVSKSVTESESEVVCMSVMLVRTCVHSECDVSQYSNTYMVWVHECVFSFHLNKMCVCFDKDQKNASKTRNKTYNR